jgi:GNAT superfamily N-acetyltransferase
MNAPDDFSPLEAKHGAYTVSTRRDRLDVSAIHAYLVRSYWAEGIPRETVERSLRHSLCFGLYGAGGAQVGFARVVSDGATFAYLCDVYVLESEQGRGLGKWLIETAMRHPDLQGLRRFMLATRDAHGLYARHGFAPLRAPARMMEILHPDLYKKSPA